LAFGRSSSSIFSPALPGHSCSRPCTGAIPVSLVGASGAIMGILGGFARLYPTDKVSIFFLPPIPVYIVVIAYASSSSSMIPFGGRTAYEAHVGGLAMGVLVAPLVIKLPSKARLRGSGEGFLAQEAGLPLLSWKPC